MTTKNPGIIYSLKSTPCNLCGSSDGEAKILSYYDVDISSYDYFKCFACGKSFTPKNDGSFKRSGNFSEYNSFGLCEINTRGKELTESKRQELLIDLHKRSMKRYDKSPFAKYLINVIGEPIREHLKLCNVGADYQYNTVFWYYDLMRFKMSSGNVLRMVASRCLIRILQQIYTKR
jgi:hypothetical protein